ncbi:MAG: DUF4129 domain-containing protein, partial [Oscillospiraceae bacterium]|nr:DUF4129 domain-containing protein [Oscillospiraceae bacterium]
WSEVYFEGIGWFPIDPLGWNSQAPLNEDAPSDVSASALPSSSDVSQSEIQPEEQPQSNGGAGHRERASVWLPLLFIFTISSLVFAWALFFGPGYMNRRWSYEAVSRRLGPDTGGRLDAVYRDVLRLLGLHGLAVQPGETLVTFPGRVDRLINFDGITLSETAGAVMRMHFGGRSPDDGEIARACLYHRQLEALTLESLGKLKYAYKRLLPTILLPQK